MFVWNLRYRVRAGTTPVAFGGATLRIERVGLASEYRITYWEDRRDTGDVPSWGKRRLDTL